MLIVDLLPLVFRGHPRDVQCDFALGVLRHLFFEDRIRRVLFGLNHKHQVVVGVILCAQRLDAPGQIDIDALEWNDDRGFGAMIACPGRNGALTNATVAVLTYLEHRHDSLHYPQHPQNRYHCQPRFHDWAQYIVLICRPASPSNHLLAALWRWQRPGQISRITRRHAFDPAAEYPPKGLPIFEVVFEDDGGFEVREISG